MLGAGKHRTKMDDTHRCCTLPRRKLCARKSRIQKRKFTQKGKKVGEEEVLAFET